MSGERSDPMFELLKLIEADLGAMKREQTSQGMRLASIEKRIAEQQSLKAGAAK